MRMCQRCFNKNEPKYKYYGGRGITVCDRWRRYPNFLEDMGEAPPKMTLDRIDNNKGYEPGNCRWATRFEQARNRRTNVFWTHNGITLCLKDWATRLGMPKNTLTQRRAYGWSVERSLTEPVRKGSRPRKQTV